MLKTDDTVSISTTEHFSRLTVPQVKVTDAGNYEISVKNSIGQATAMSTVNVHDVPGQVPGRPYASDTSLRSVILSWGCPSSDGGSPVTGYRVEMCEAETEVWQTLTEQCHSTSYHVADLLPHTPYFFQMMMMTMTQTMMYRLLSVTSRPFHWEMAQEIYSRLQAIKKLAQELLAKEARLLGLRRGSI